MHLVQVARTLNSDIGRWELMDQDALPVLPVWAGRGRVWAPEVTCAYALHNLHQHSGRLQPSV